MFCIDGDILLLLLDYGTTRPKYCTVHGVLLARIPRNISSKRQCADLQTIVIIIIINHHHHHFSSSSSSSSPSSSRLWKWHNKSCNEQIGEEDELFRPRNILENWTMHILDFVANLCDSFRLLLSAQTDQESPRTPVRPHLQTHNGNFVFKMTYANTSCTGLQVANSLVTPCTIRHEDGPRKF